VIIKSAEFVTSAVKPGQYPAADLPEIAFAGRSNVGKSSLINTLVNRKNLVKTSATPGKTRLINFFSINEQFVFVDLPGYGYAKVSKQERALWGPMVEAYLAGRRTLKGVILLQDIRRDPGKEEHDLAQFLSHIGLPFLLAFTKVDKLSKNQQTTRLKQIRETFSLQNEDFVLFSSKTGQGKDLTWQRIVRLLEMEENKSDASGEKQEMP
jgi:GTP-binding protein